MQELDSVGEVGCNGKWDIFFAVIMFVVVIRTPQGDLLLSGYLVLQQTEARLIKISKTPYVRIHYYGARKEKLSTITTINVPANTRYAHINDDFFN